MEHRKNQYESVEYYLNKGRSERSIHARKLAADAIKQISKIFLNHHNQDEAGSDISFGNCPKSLGKAA